MNCIMFCVGQGMAARTRKVALTDSWKANLRASALMTRLQAAALGTVEMTPTQIQAAKIVLAKILPDLSASKVEAEVVSRELTPEERRKRIAALAAKLD